MRTLVLIVAAAAAGCGTGTADVPPALKVAVTLDGQPAPRLTVQLLAADGSPVGTGVTADDGTAAVFAAGGKPIPPGKYTVMLADAGEAEENPMEARKKATKSRLPAAVGKPTSPLSVTVEAGTTEYRVDAKSK